MSSKSGRTGLRECCGIIATTIGPTPAKYRQLPRSATEIRQFLEAAMTHSDAEGWHEVEIKNILAEPDLKESEMRTICEKIGASFVRGCKRTQDLRLWAENGLVPKDIYNERHLLNTALGHVKCAFEEMEAISKTPELNLEGSLARAIAVRYFMQLYQLQLVLMKVAYGPEYEDYFGYWYETFQAPDRIVVFDTLEPLGTYIESDMRDFSLSSVLAPIDSVPLRHLPYGDTGPKQIPKVFPNNREYGDSHVFNAMTAGEVARKYGNDAVFNAMVDLCEKEAEDKGKEDTSKEDKIKKGKRNWKIVKNRSK